MRLSESAHSSEGGAAETGRLGFGQVACAAVSIVLRYSKYTALGGAIGAAFLPGIVVALESNPEVVTQIVNVEEAILPGCTSPDAADEKSAQLLLEDTASREAVSREAARLADVALSGAELHNSLIGFIAAKNGLQVTPLDDETYSFIQSPRSTDTIDQSLQVANAYTNLSDVHIILNDKTVRGADNMGKAIDLVRPIDPETLSEDQKDRVNEEIRTALLFVSLLPKDFAGDVGLRQIAISLPGEALGQGWGQPAALTVIKDGVMYVTTDSEGLENLWHEMGHFIDFADCGSINAAKDEAIASFNAPDFRYQVAIRDNPNPDSDDPHATHISQYAMTHLKEDKAETIGQIISHPLSLNHLSPALKGKLATLLARMNRLPRQSYDEYLIDLASLF